MINLKRNIFSVFLVLGFSFNSVDVRADDAGKNAIAVSAERAARCSIFAFVMGRGDENEWMERANNFADSYFRDLFRRLENRSTSLNAATSEMPSSLLLATLSLRSIPLNSDRLVGASLYAARADASRDVELFRFNIGKERTHMESAAYLFESEGCD